jgi:hypothetical protein
MSRAALKTGTRIGPFVLESLIGRGGTGDVYRAVHQDLERTVALKLLTPTLAVQEEFTLRFLREARTMQTLEHPAIVTVYDAGEADGQLYLAMRLVGKASLKHLISEGKGSIEQATSILRRLAEALDYAHSRGIVHRDIKPANILLDHDLQPVLADFGLAKALDDTSTTVSSQYLGTPLYLAPEQASGGPISHRADLYSFACVAFELLTGTTPYTEPDSLSLLLAHGSCPVPRATEREHTLPPAVDDVFTRALAKAATDRYPSAEAFVDALGEALMGNQRPRGMRRRWVGGSVAGVIVLIGALVAGLVVWHPSPGPSSKPSAQHAATSAGVPRGRLVYQAKMDGTGVGFADLVGRPNDPAHETVRFLPHMLELATLSGDADAGTDLKLVDGVTTYIGDIDISVKPGSDALFCWGLRWAVQGKLAYEMCVDTAAQFAQLDVWDGQNQVPISPRVDIAGLQTGRTVPITVVVLDTHLTLFIDGKQATDVENHQVPTTLTLPGLDVYSGGRPGTVDIHALSLYALAGS